MKPFWTKENSKEEVSGILNKFAIVVHTAQDERKQNSYLPSSKCSCKCSTDFWDSRCERTQDLKSSFLLPSPFELNRG